MSKLLELVVRVPETVQKEFYLHGLESVLQNCEIELMEHLPEVKAAGGAVSTVPTVSEVQEKETPAGKTETVLHGNNTGQEKPQRKLIKIRCKDCGKFASALLEKEEDGKYHITCRDCGARYAFSDNDLSKIEYNCPNCGTYSYSYMADVEKLAIDYDICRNCKETVPLNYEPTMRRYSAK